MPIKFVIAAVAALAVAACAASGPGSSKFDQTWTKPYGETTCVDWDESMSDHQRFVMAADMLYAAQRDDGASGLPSDELIRLFQRSIDAVCQAEGREIGERVGEVAAALYIMSVDFKP